MWVRMTSNLYNVTICLFVLFISDAFCYYEINIIITHYLPIRLVSENDHKPNQTIKQSLLLRVQ